MTTYSHRVLLVDDVERWRSFVRTRLQGVPGFRIIGEAEDGIEAVDQAAQLRPDVIVLDIGLPKLNGIEAARRIRENVPNAKILFFSENREWDIAEQALRIGTGYLIKFDAAAELLPAVEAVLDGQQFLSSTLERNHNAEKQHTPPQIPRSVAPLPPRNIEMRHEVEFYDDHLSFVDGFVRVVQATLSAGNIAIVIATASHRADILLKMKANGMNIDLAIEKGSYVAVDASEALSSFMVNDMPDPQRCAKAVSDLLARAKENANRNPSRIAICGECAPTLLSRGNQEGAVRLEHLWDEITRHYEVDTLCGYLLPTLSQHHNSSAFQRICAEHTAIHGRRLGY